MIRLLAAAAVIYSCHAVSVYDYFTGDGITEGLTAVGDEFKLNGKEFKILSGSLHYFRVHPDNWRIRMKQYKAAGLNTLDVYVPWNLHEPRRDVFDFGDANTSQFTPFLNITRFLEMAKEEDMLVIFRPGPYICGEWEFGGLPSWLLHNQPMFFRSSFAGYEERAELFLLKLLDQVRDFQFYTAEGASGGPIIMTQIENEFGNYGYSDYPRDKNHLKFIKKVLRDGGIESLLFTSDTPELTADWGNIDYELMTANFKCNSEAELKRLKELRPNAPILVSEFWPGWFDHWFQGDIHNVLSEPEFREILGNIFTANGSVNFYMFHGGTNLGFMNGANILGFSGLEVPPVYVPDVTSYDYDAPLSESGQYTPKYYATREMIAAYDPLYDVIDRVEPPEEPAHFNYGQIEMLEMMSFADIVSGISSDKILVYEKPVSMEELEINEGNGQDYGYLVYRKTVEVSPGSVLKVRGHIRDLGQVMIDGVMVSEPLTTIHLLNTFGSWAIRDSEFTIPEGISGSVVLELMVENLGRANFGVPHTFDQRKGIWQGDILIDDQVINDWEHIPLEMTGELIRSFKGWRSIDRSLESLPLGPKLLRGILNVEQPLDTFFDYGCSECLDWLHGAVWVNGFNIGRYFQTGPQRTLYIPGPLLKPGENEIVVFENYAGSTQLRFTDTPNLGEPLQSQVC